MKKDDTDLLKYFRYINNCIDDKRDDVGWQICDLQIYFFF